MWPPRVARRVAHWNLGRTVMCAIGQCRLRLPPRGVDSIAIVLRDSDCPAARRAPVRQEALTDPASHGGDMAVFALSDFCRRQVVTLRHHLISQRNIREDNLARRRKQIDDNYHRARREFLSEKSSRDLAAVFAGRRGSAPHALRAVPAIWTARQPWVVPRPPYFRRQRHDCFDFDRYAPNHDLAIPWAIAG
jgi:hypothetical protein